MLLSSFHYNCTLTTKLSKIPEKSYFRKMLSVFLALLHAARHTYMANLYFYNYSSQTRHRVTENTKECDFTHLYYSSAVWHFIVFVLCIKSLVKNRETDMHSSLCAYLSICLWLYSPLLDLGRFLSFFMLYTVGRTPSTGDHPIARPLSAQDNTNME
jgi:hypothetical protein